jgi:hypothetical protein
VGDVFARVAVYDIPGNRMNEAVESFRSAITRIREMQPKEVLVLVSPEEGRALTMSLWEQRGALEASRMTATRVRGDAARAVDGTVQSVVEYEVAFHETNGS